MMAKLIYVTIFLFIISCTPSLEKDESNKENVKDSTVTFEKKSNDSIILSNILKTNLNLKFPYNCESTEYQLEDTFNLSGFKSRKLTNLPFQLIVTDIPEYYIDDRIVSDTTFNLVDKNYVAHWNILSKQPNFILLEDYDVNQTYAYLVTVSYDLSVIDAIRSIYHEGNPNYNAGRNVTIFQDLSLVIHGYYNVLEDMENQTFNSEHSKENWYIDKEGHFKKGSL